MTKKPDPDQAAPGQLRYSPFAQLAKQPTLAAKLATPVAAKPEVRAKPNKPAPPLKVRMQLQPVGRAGKVVTRITGLPLPNVAAIAERLRKALGCTATVDDTDVILHGSLQERAQEWLDRVGDLHAIVDPSTRRPPHELSACDVRHESSTPPAALQADGTRRSDIRRGRRVAIVLKADQDTGRLTQGVVRDVLTNSVVHPRGIKVRLESGEVGRVKVIYE